MPAKQKKSSNKKVAAVVPANPAKAERRRRARQARNARKRAEKMTAPANMPVVESKVGVKPGALSTLFETARGQAHQVAAMMMAVAAPAAIRPVRLADSLSPERTSILAFQQRMDMVVVPPAETEPAVGQLKPVLGRAAFLIADPLYPLWLQGRPALCGAPGQHFSMHRTLVSGYNKPHLSNLDNTTTVDYSSLSGCALLFGTPEGAVPAPNWMSPLGFHDNTVGWVYKPKCMMYQGFVALSNLTAPSMGALVEVEVQYYNGEVMDEYVVNYVYQAEQWVTEASHSVIPFIAATAVNSEQPPFDFPGGNEPRQSEAGWYRVKSFSLTPDIEHPGTTGIKYVASLEYITLGLTTDVRTGTLLSSYGDSEDCVKKPLIRPGFTSSNQAFSKPYTLKETSVDASFFPCMSTQYVTEAPVMYRNCRTTAAAALFSNVTAEINKEGTVRAVRSTRSVVNPWADWRTDRTFTAVNPDYCKNFKLCDGLYVFAMPDVKTLKFRDCVHDRTSATGGLEAAGFVTAAVMDIGGFDNVMMMLFTDAGAGSTTHLQVTVDTHLEFKHNSPLWELRVTEMAPDDMSHAIKALQQMQHMFENPLHLSDILKYVQKAAGLLLPHVSPFLVDAYNKVAAPAVGYSIVPYRG